MAAASTTHAPTGPAALGADQDFLFDLEAQIYDLEALSSSLETMMVSVTRHMRTVNRGQSAAIDFAVVHLADKIKGLADSYWALRQPETAPAP